MIFSYYNGRKPGLLFTIKSCRRHSRSSINSVVMILSGASEGDKVCKLFFYVKKGFTLFRKKEAPNMSLSKKRLFNLVICQLIAVFDIYLIVPLGIFRKKFPIDYFCYSIF